MKLFYQSAWDFEDYKGWIAMCGAREEGTITWRSVDNDLVVSEGHPPGFSYMGAYPNHDVVGEGFETFEEARASFEQAIFGEVQS